MVVLGFFLIMIVVFFVASFFVLLNLIFIFIWKLRKRSGKKPKKIFVIIPTVFLIISLVADLIPIGWVATVRSANTSVSSKIVKAESGKIVYWTSLPNGDSTLESFEMDGVKYDLIRLGGSKNIWKLGKPVANIKFKSAEQELNKFLTLLFGRDDTGTVYPITNISGVKVFMVGGDVYCSPNDMIVVTKYYDDNSNNNTQNSK